MRPATTEWRVYLRANKTEAHRKWLKRGKVGEGRVDLEDKNLTRAVFSGVDLADSRFVRCNWSNSNISGDFAEAEITECIWNNSLLYGVHFDRASIEKCNFTDTYLGIAHFISAKVKGGDWRRCDLDKSTWNSAVVENVCFERVNFKEARFHGNHFLNCDLRNANFKSATLRGAVFENCDFRGAYLYDFVFEKVTFINCGFHGCIGIPAFEGEYAFISPDLSEDFDGTGIVETEDLLEQWKSKAPLSLRQTANYPQWLDCLSREIMVKQVRWVSAGMNGSRPMDLRGEDISRAFAYKAYFRAARFTDCDFTASDLRRTMVQQAEFIRCKFDDALLMYLEGRQETSLDVETTKVIFKNCTAKGAYFNRSELWVAEFTGGNWDGSFFNNCMWTLAEFDNVSFENTDWRGAKLDSVKFVNCNFRNALFHKANIRASEFINCDFRGTDFGFVDAKRVTMEQCAFYRVKGMVFDVEPLAENEIRAIDADLSANFDGSLVSKSLERTQDLFTQIENMNSSGDDLVDEPQTVVSESSKSDPKAEMLESTDDSAPKSQSDPEIQPESTEPKGVEQLQQELDSDKKQLTQLRSQLKQVEERIIQARKTNIFGRKQSGENERERDRITQEIKDIKIRIAQNETSIQYLSPE